MTSCFRRGAWRTSSAPSNTGSSAARPGWRSWSRYTRSVDDTLKALQVGLEWFPERPGGLNRVFYDLTRHLPESGVDVTALVTGAKEVSRGAGGRVVPVCPTAAPLPVRCWQFRRHAARYLKHSYSLVA